MSTSLSYLLVCLTAGEQLFISISLFSLLVGNLNRVIQNVSILVTSLLTYKL